MNNLTEKLKLSKDLVFFDIEATGLHVIRDRIVQIALLKYSPFNADPQELSLLINPGIPISEEAMGVHGITPKDLANKPVFNQVAQQIVDFIGEADLSGYNLLRFDIPILMEELGRCGFEFSMDQRRVIDVQRIFYKMEPRTLKAAHQFYCNQPMENAHDAMADVHATANVLAGQLAKYEGQDLVGDDGETVAQPIVGDMDVLHQFTNDLKTIDATQRMKLDANGVAVFNFGKYIGKPVAKTLIEDHQYYNWILNKEFSIQVKQIVKKLVKDYKKAQKQKNA